MGSVDGPSERVTNHGRPSTHLHDASGNAQRLPTSPVISYSLQFGRRDIRTDLEPGVRRLLLSYGSDRSSNKRASLQRIPTPDPILYRRIRWLRSDHIYRKIPCRRRSVGRGVESPMQAWSSRSLGRQ